MRLHSLIYFSEKSSPNVKMRACGRWCTLHRAEIIKTSLDLFSNFSNLALRFIEYLVPMRKLMRAWWRSHLLRQTKTETSTTAMNNTQVCWRIKINMVKERNFLKSFNLNYLKPPREVPFNNFGFAQTSANKSLFFVGTKLISECQARILQRY